MGSYKRLTSNMYRVTLDINYLLTLGLKMASFKPERRTQDREAVTVEFPYKEAFVEDDSEILLEKLQQKLNGAPNLLNRNQDLRHIFSLITKDIKIIKNVKAEAVKLAKEHKKSEPNITEIFWWPNRAEIRLIEVEKDVPLSVGDEVEVFYFTKSDDISFNSAIGIVRPEEVKKLKLPKNWKSDWEFAEKLLEIDA